MKTYTQVIDRAVGAVYHAHMNGDMIITVARYVDGDTVAYIYGKAADQVYNDIKAGYRHCIQLAAEQ